MIKPNHNTQLKESNMKQENHNTVFWDIIGEKINLGHHALKPGIDSS
jgi:hypothetical protein